MNQSEPLRYAIIGTGGIAKAHAEAIRKNAQSTLVGVYDVVRAKAEKFAAEHGAGLVFETLEALLGSKQVQAVTICTPPRTHAGIVQAACRAGKPVLCEKPVVLSLKELDETVAVQQATRGVVGCVFQWRSGRGVRMMRRLVEAGLTGRLLWANVQIAWYRNQAYYEVPWRGRWENESGGVSVSQSIHAIDALLHVAGPAKRVTAHIRTLNHKIEVEDYAQVLVEFANGAGAVLQMTVDCLKERSQLMFGFERLTAISNDSPYNVADFPWTYQAVDHQTGDPLKLGAAAAEEHAAMVERQRQIDAVRAEMEAWPSGASHAAQIGDFTQAVREGRAPAVGLEDCRLSAEFLSALYKSAHAGGAAVTLPIGQEDRHYATWNGIV